MNKKVLSCAEFTPDQSNLLSSLGLHYINNGTNKYFEYEIQFSKTVIIDINEYIDNYKYILEEIYNQGKRDGKEETKEEIINKIRPKRMEEY